jgi:hypothetical protein
VDQPAPEEGAVSETVLSTPAARAAGPWPADLVRTPTGRPAVLLVRTGRGWTPLRSGEPVEGLAATEPMALVEAMTLADLMAEEAGATPEPGRQARLAARKGSEPDLRPPAPTEDAEPDPRDAELAVLRRTVGQLEHALAARVSIERAIGVLAERHGIAPREAFEELRRRARAHGRPAQELAREVLDKLMPPAVPGGHTTVPERRSTADPVPGPRAERGSSSPRRVARRIRQLEGPGSEAETHP